MHRKIELWNCGAVCKTFRSESRRSRLRVIKSFTMQREGNRLGPGVFFVFLFDNASDYL